MVFVITGTGTRTAESLEGSTTDAARLVIDYTLTPADTCEAPLNLSASNISASSVDLNWNTVAQTNVVYEWILMEAGIPPNIENAQFTGTSSNEFAQVTGLLDNTTYDVYVRSNCEDDNVSGWSNLVQFTTDINCNAPTNLSANNLTQSGVDLSWNSVIGAVNGYDWVVMADGILPDSSTALFSGSTLDLTVQVTGLSNFTTYDAYVRSDCGSENNSNWSLALKFTTVDECDPLTSGNIDSDGDSVADICDIDDDNDGVLDVDETRN
jgi:chitodextrinase